jgi:hypothetical protein
MAAMPDIVLATQNAKWIHASFGLRCLRANLGPLRERSVIREFEIGQRPVDVAEAILAEQPRIVGLGVYVWNASVALQLVRILKRVRSRPPHRARRSGGQPRDGTAGDLRARRPRGARRSGPRVPRPVPPAARRRTRCRT